LPVELTAGDNLFIFLCDNMGRLSEGAVLDRKGILGPTYCDGRVVDLPAAVWSSPAAPPTNSWPYQTYRNVNSGGKLARASYTIQPRPGQGLQLALRWFPQYAWIQIDGRLVGEHAGDLSLAGGVDFSTFVIDSYVGAKPARLDITLFGESARDFESHVRLLAYDKSSELSKWAFRPWQDPQAPGDAPSGHPLWWECEFQKPRIPGPFFIVPDGLSKGQAYLNGHALGRFWEIGPQRALYVPDPWFEAHNRLAILDEEGRSPERVYLMRDARVPVESVLV
jgi:hypothetical protein